MAEQMEARGEPVVRVTLQRRVSLVHR
jgi:hypothetical protein